MVNIGSGDRETQTIFVIVLSLQATLELLRHFLLFARGLLVIEKEELIERVHEIVAVAGFADQLLPQAIANFVAIIVLLTGAALRSDGGLANGRGDALEAAILRDGTQIIVITLHDEKIQSFLCQLW